MKKIFAVVLTIALLSQCSFAYAEYRSGNQLNIRKIDYQRPDSNRVAPSETQGVTKNITPMQLAREYEKQENMADAIKWYKKAVETGQKNAMFCLGCIYGEGRGVAADPAEAFNWFKRAAEAGSAEGAVNAGNCYIITKQNKDFKKASEYYLKASKMAPNSKPLMHNMAYLFEIRGNFDTAIELYKAADSNYFSDYNRCNTYRAMRKGAKFDSWHKVAAPTLQNYSYSVWLDDNVDVNAIEYKVVSIPIEGDL